MDQRAKDIEDFKKQGIIITEEQYDELAMVDVCGGRESFATDVLKVLKIMNLI